MSNPEKPSCTHGNEFFRQKNKDAAIACYEEVVRLCPKENTGDLAMYYHNIAAHLEAMVDNC